MSDKIQYQCPYVFWPVVEGALAACGYTIVIPLQQASNGATAMLMKQGAVSLLLTHHPRSDVVAIEVVQSAHTSASHWREALPAQLIALLDRAGVEQTGAPAGLGPCPC